MVNGYNFMNNKGEVVCIGMTEKVEETLGLIMKSFDKMSEELRCKSDQNVKMREEIRKLKNKSFWKKIKDIYLKIIN